MVYLIVAIMFSLFVLRPRQGESYGIGKWVPDNIMPAKPTMCASGSGADHNSTVSPVIGNRFLNANIFKYVCLEILLYGQMHIELKTGLPFSYAHASCP